MTSSGQSLGDAAAAVAALGASQAEIDLLDDDALQSGLRLIRDLERELQPYRMWLAAAVARRSDHRLGFQGLARRNGFPTPAVLIQSLTGSSLDDATKLARLGEMAVEAMTEADETSALGRTGSSGSALSTAVAAGGISIDCADAIRRGLGQPDSAVTAQQLRIESERLIAHAASSTPISIVTPEMLLKLARQARTRLDADAVERGQKQRSESRAVRIWEHDGMCGGSWKLPAEDGGAEINTALKLLLASRTGGPRFRDTDAAGRSATSPADAAIEDDRTMAQILADGFAQIFHNGIQVDPSTVPGIGRAAVRVIVTESVMARAATEPARESGSGAPTGTAVLEDNLTAITLSKLGEYLCEGGMVGVFCGDDGTINLGRTRRLFTSRQNTAMAVRDGGCRFPGCTKPVSWTESHHCVSWAREFGPTDVNNGVRLCRYHHMFIHQDDWKIRRSSGPAGGTFHLIPPATIDPDRTPIPMPSKNPLFASPAPPPQAPALQT